MGISCAIVRIRTAYQEIATPLRARNDGGSRWLGDFAEKDLFISINPLNFWKAFVIMEVAEKRELPNLSVF